MFWFFSSSAPGELVVVKGIRKSEDYIKTLEENNFQLNLGLGSNHTLRASKLSENAVKIS